MQKFRGNSYRGRRQPRAAGSGGLSIPSNVPPSVSPGNPGGGYSSPGKPANKNNRYAPQRYHNFKGYKPPTLPKGNIPRSVPRGAPINPAWAAGAAAGLTRAGYLGLLFGGAFLVGFGLGRLYRRYFVGGRWAMLMKGYTEILTCVAPKGIIEGAGFAANCSPGSVATSLGTKWDGKTRPASLHSRGSPSFQELPGGFRGVRAVKWTRTFSVERPWNLPNPHWDPFHPTDPWVEPEVPNPTVDPLSSPIGQPMPFPEPMPWRAIPEVVPNPWRSPTEQPQRGPQPKPRQRPYGRPTPAPEPVTPPVGQPNPAPLPPPVVVAPGPGPKPVPPRPSVRPQRPGKRTKEKKGRTSNAAALMAAANFASEVGDLVGAIWKALPKEFRSKPKYDPWSKKYYEVGALQKAADIYNNFEHVDQEKMWENIFNEIGEDMFYGSIGQALRSGNRKAGFRPNFIGIGAGPAL